MPLTEFQQAQAADIACRIHAILCASSQPIREPFLARVCALVEAATEKDHPRTRRISGLFNLRGADGHLILFTKRSLWDLAILCMEAIGCGSDCELVMPLSLMEMYAGPPVDWDRKLPLLALQELAASVGHHVVFGEQSVRFVAGPALASQE